MGAAQARAIIEAKLGRSPQDSLESAVVLEAWGGIRGHLPFELGAASLGAGFPLDARSRPTDAITWGQPACDRDTLGLVLVTFATAAWVGVMAARYRWVVVASACQSAVPANLALQAVLMRRYLGVADGLGRLRRAWPTLVVLVVLVLSMVLLVVGRGRDAPTVRLVAVTLVLTWVAGVVSCERRWGASFAALVAGCCLAVQAGAPAGAVATVLAAAAVGVVTTALTTAATSPRRPVPWSRVLPSVVVAGSTGLLILVAMSSQESNAALALVPALGGSLWGARHLSRLWVDLRAILLQTAVGDGGRGGLRRSLSGVLAGVLAGALARQMACSGIMAVGLLILAPTTSLPVAQFTGVLVIVLWVGVVGFLALVLDTCGRPVWAVAVVVSALMTAVLVSTQPSLSLLPVVTAGIVAAWPLAAVLAEADFVLVRSAL